MSFLSLTFITVCIFFITSLPKYASQTPNKISLQTYIVHVEAPDDDAHIMSESEELESWYRSFLPAATTATSSGEESEASIVYSYRHVFKGFAARLSPEQVKEMETKRGFVSARPQKMMSLHTTHSPNFLGLNPNTGLWKETNYGEGVIIGVLDTGVLPEHPSFDDEGMPPPPAKWKGKCQFNHTTCNNKIIGARYFYADDHQSPLDDRGHGTHTASTAAGRFAQGANLFSIANGTASGVAPLAHLAIYKACCGESDALAGMDAAIEDGVDVLSISLSVLSENLYEDSIAIGAFRAMEKGVFVSCSAGNNGPSPSSVKNGAPWILTVGASTIDRRLSAKAVLGNGQQFDGESASQSVNFSRKLLPLVYAGMLNASDDNAPYCFNESLSGSDIRGKIVVCEQGGIITRVEKGAAVKSGGGAGMILINYEKAGHTVTTEAHVLPTTLVTYAAGLKIKAYINSKAAPTATISFQGTHISPYIMWS